MNLARRPIPGAVIITALFAAFLISLPAIAGYFSAPQGYVFTGFDWQDDFHLYASYIKQASEKPALFMENRFTTEPQGGVYVFLYFSLLGMASLLTGLDAAAVFLIGRFFVVVIFLLLLWRVLKGFFPEQQKRLAAFLVCAFGGGIGWLASAGALLVPRLADLRSTDLNYSLGYSTFGHLAFPLPFLAYALFLLVFLSLLKYFETRDKKFMAGAVVLHALIFFVHPASIAVFSLVLLMVPVVSFARTKKMGEALRYVKDFLPFVLSAGIVALYVFLASQDFAYGKSVEAYMSWERGEPLLFFLVGYGLLIPLGIYGIAKLRGKSGFATDFLLAWIIGAFLAALSPQKGVKLMFALHAPLAIAASIGLFALAERLALPWKVQQKTIVVASIVLLSLSAPFILSQRITDTTNQDFQSGPFLSEADYGAIKFLATQPKGSVLSSYRIGNNIPYLTAHKVFLGHWTETADVRQKEATVKSFFAGAMNPQEQRGFLEKNGIDYVFYGGNERKMGKMYSGIGLKEIYSSGGTVVYRVSLK